MKSASAAVSLLVAVAILPVGALALEPSCFLGIEGIPGESMKDMNHKGWIDVLSWSVGHALPSAPGMGQAPRAQPQPFRFTALMNKASAGLHQLVASGKPIRSAQLDCETSQGSKLFVTLSIKFKNLLVLSYQLSSPNPVPVFSQGGVPVYSSVPQDQVALSFQNITIEYHPPDGTPPVSSTWDVTAK